MGTLLLILPTERHKVSGNRGAEENTCGSDENEESDRAACNKGPTFDRQCSDEDDADHSKMRRGMGISWH
jgi:hypothetical protein